VSAECYTDRALDESEERMMDMDGEPQTEMQVELPVVKNVKTVITSLTNMRDHKAARCLEFDALPLGSPARESRARGISHERREHNALEDAVRVMEWFRDRVDDACESERLLTDLVAAVREQREARTTEERAAAQAHLEESMGRAGPFIDDLA
jgi:hypothetical protein